MNMKIVALAAVLALVALAAYMYVPKATVESTTATSANDVSVAIASQYDALIQEELSNMSADQADFNNQVQDDIANDLSVYYT